MKRTLRRLAAGLIPLLALAGCGGAAGEETSVGTAAGASSRPLLVVTTSILGDAVRGIAGDAATVEVLMPAGVDPHAFEPSAQQVELMGDADLLVANGLGLEEGLVDVLEGVEADGVPVLHVAEQVDPIAYTGGDAHDHGSLDPHFWTDPVRMAQAVRLIGRRMAAVAGDGDWTSSADAYATEVEGLHEEILAMVSEVPEEHRKLVTNHESYGYFADRYGFEEIGTVIPSGSTLAEPSAAELTKLVETIEHEDVPAVFAESTNSARLAEAVAAEVGADIEIVELLSGSLAVEGEEGDTYPEMMRIDARRITSALAE